jgi:N6-L-threonylcarbamoyladenine synthase
MSERDIAGQPLSQAHARTEAPVQKPETADDDGPIILGIESTCDETAAGIVRGRTLLANVVASSMDQHARFGGVIPEIASRAHAEAFVPVVSRALEDADLDLSQIDAIAVSAGPGLAGCLAVGVSGAKALALAANKPIYGINHVIGHIAVTQLQFGGFPDGTLALIVSGGHTSLLRVHDIARSVEVVGTTLDDAAGECFDKVARLLGFPYPGGPHIDRHARSGDPHALQVPRALTKGNAGRRHPYDFSFSGVKTAVARWVEERKAEGKDVPVDDVCASLADAVADVLSGKAMKACENLGADTLIVGGGFSANSQLRHALLERGRRHGVEVRLPRRQLCTDNGAMVAMLGSNLLEAGMPPSPESFSIDSAMPLDQIYMA